MTKKEYCEYLLQDFSRSEDKKVSEITESDILKSSKLAVAMEYLGMLKSKEMKNYAESRGGTVFFLAENHEEPAILSARELIALLPE